MQGGRITDTELDAIRKGFKDAPDDAFRVLVVHHHLVELEQLGDHDLVRGAESAFRVAHKAGVGLILCGHLHIPHVADVMRHPGDSIIVATAGTTTSNRGRGDDPAANHFNIIEVDEHQIRIQERQFDAGKGAFEETADYIYHRNAARA